MRLRKDSREGKKGYTVENGDASAGQISKRRFKIPTKATGSLCRLLRRESSWQLCPEAGFEHSSSSENKSNCNREKQSRKHTKDNHVTTPPPGLLNKFEQITTKCWVLISLKRWYLLAISLFNYTLSEKSFLGYGLSPSTIFCCWNCSHLVQVYVIKTHYFPFSHKQTVIFLTIIAQGQVHQRPPSRM